MATPPRVVHRKSVTIADSEEAAAAGELLPSDWNDEHELTNVAGLDSPEFVNEPTAPTPPPGDKSKRLATMEALHSIAAPKRLTLFAPGDVQLPSDVALVTVKKTVPAAFTITLASSLDLVGETVTIKDRMLVNGAGAGTYNVTISPSGSETLDGATSIKLDVDNMALSFRKIRDDAGTVTGEGYELV